MTRAEFDKFISEHFRNQEAAANWFGVSRRTILEWNKQAEYPRWVEIIVKNERPPVSVQVSRDRAAEFEAGLRALKPPTDHS